SREKFDLANIALGGGTRTMVGICQLHHAILPDSYHMLKVSCSMFGFIAIYLFYRAAVKWLKAEDPRIFYVLALYPSILFWSSILGKDPVMLLGVAVYAYAVVSWQRTFRYRYVALMAL